MTARLPEGCLAVRVVVVFRLRRVRDANGHQVPLYVAQGLDPPRLGPGTLPNLALMNDLSHVRGGDAQARCCLQRPVDGVSERVMRRAHATVLPNRHDPPRHAFLDAHRLQVPPGVIGVGADVLEAVRLQPHHHRVHAVRREGCPRTERVGVDAFETGHVAPQAVRELAAHVLIDARQDAVARPPRLLVGEHACGTSGQTLHVADVHRRGVLGRDDFLHAIEFVRHDALGPTLNGAHDEHLAVHVVAADLVARIAHRDEKLADLVAHRATARVREPFEFVDVREVFLERHVLA